VSYLIRAGGMRVLSGSGLSGGKAESALARNAQMLGAPLGDLDAVVISHLHLDHVGGLRAVRRRTFAFAAEPLEPSGVPAHVPTRMHHPRADIAVTTHPQVIGPGIAVLPPLPRMLFWLGCVTEQALVVHVRGFGLVLISGRGHPRTEQILGVTEQVPGIPIRAVAGGLHLPVHAAGTPLIPQAVLGNPQLSQGGNPPSAADQGMRQGAADRSDDGPGGTRAQDGQHNTAGARPRGRADVSPLADGTLTSPDFLSGFPSQPGRSYLGITSSHEEGALP
jgi:hypothetical protein